MDFNEVNQFYNKHYEANHHISEEHHQHLIEKVDWENEKLELHFDEEKQYTADLENEIAFLKNQIIEEKATFIERNLSLEDETNQKSRELQTNTAFLKELKSLCKVLEQKSINFEKLLSFLESLVKSEEDFTINLDQFISRSLQGVLNRGGVECFAGRTKINGHNKSKAQAQRAVERIQGRVR
jgi:hypothetical protein